MRERDCGVPTLKIRYDLVPALLAGVMLALSAVASASAQDAEPEGYRKAVDEAVSEFSGRNFEEARSFFARADALFQNARTQRGLGLAEFELRNYVACIGHFEAALASTVKPLDESLRKETEQLLARAKTFVGRFVIDTKPAASGLMVDGFGSQMPKDRTLALEVGDHYLELYAEHYSPEKRMLSVKGGESELLHIDFSRPSAPAPAAHLVDSPRWYESPWLWVAVGVVVAGAATGVVVAATSGDAGPRASGGSSGRVVTGP